MSKETTMIRTGAGHKSEFKRDFSGVIEDVLVSNNNKNSNEERGSIVDLVLSDGNGNKIDRVLIMGQTLQNVSIDGETFSVNAEIDPELLVGKMIKSSAKGIEIETLA